MNRSHLRILGNISYTVLANGINTAVSMAIAFVIPKVLGVREYSYWQLYAFYTSYVGFFHFGWADGIYLQFGGKKYRDLDKQYFANQFWLLVIMEVMIAVVIGMIAVFTIKDSNKSLIVIITGICCVIQIPRTMLQYILQTTDRIRDYAKNYMLEKAVYAVLVITIIASGFRNYEILLGADLAARMCTLLLLCFRCRDIVHRSMRDIGSAIKQAGLNIMIGIKLMFANIASLLLIGIVRFAIEDHWDIETFGKVSLTLTVSNMLMIFISSVGVVMYPLLKNTSKDRLPYIYKNLRIMLMVPVLGMLILYYPARMFLAFWLPQYSESLRYMALLFPMCIFESKMSMLISTYLKALRYENFIMKVNWYGVGLTFVTTYVLVYVLNNLTLAIASLTILLGIRSVAAEKKLSKELGLKVWTDIMMELALAILFMIVSWKIQSLWCTFIYGLAYIIYLALHKTEIMEAVNRIKKLK